MRGSIFSVRQKLIHRFDHLEVYVNPLTLTTNKFLAPASNQLSLQLLYETANFLQKRASNCFLVL